MKKNVYRLGANATQIIRANERVENDAQKARVSPARYTTTPKNKKEV